MGEYDAIIVGCTISTLISGLSLLKEGYKVLILDKANSIGELYEEIKIGRFNFYSNLDCLCLNSSLYDYSLNSILTNCNIDSTLNAVNMNCFCNVIINNKNYTIPFGIDEFISYLNDNILDSKEVLEKLFEYAKDTREAIDYIYSNCDNIDYSILRKEHKRFWSISDSSLSNGLENLNITGDLRDVLLRISIFFGNISEDMAFVDYLLFLINGVEYGIRIVEGGNNTLFNLLLKKYNDLNGSLRLSANVISIIVEDEVINGVRLDNGEAIYTNKLIMNDRMSNVYELIDPCNVPRKALKHCNKLVNGAKVFSLHIGVSDNFNLKTGLYIIDEKTIAHNYSRSSNKMISIYRYMSDSELKKINQKNMLQFNDTLAMNLIDNISSTLGINITDFIEEIKVISVFDNSELKYEPILNNGVLFRMINVNNEKYIQGLYVIDGFDADLFSYDSSLLAALNVVKYFAKEGSSNE